MGHGDAEDRLQPTLVSALDGQKIESVICGADHSTAYSESELQVYSCGWYVIHIFSTSYSLTYIAFVSLFFFLTV